MKVIHAGPFIVFPGRPAEAGCPVIGRASADRSLPYIVIPVGIIRRTAALYKPGVFIRCMVHNQVHYQLHPFFMYLCQKPVQVLHGAEHIHDSLIIADIITIVIPRRLIHRGEPYYINSQILKVIQAAPDTVQVADAVTVAVLEASGVNLIHHAFFPPCPLFFHVNPPLHSDS